MNVWLYSLVSVFVVSLISLIGVFTLSFQKKTLEKLTLYFVAFSSGALLGDVFLHLLPETVAEHGFGLHISFNILFGIGFSFVVEKIIHWRHCHHATTQDHPHPFAIMNLVGDAVHNFIDGLVIGASYLVSVPVGLATTLAVVFHEIPQEIGDFGVLLHGGFSKKKALLVNFLTALTSVLGVVAALVLHSYMENITVILIPFAAGNFLYIAGSDLIPELHKKSQSTWRSTLQLLVMCLGVAVMYALLFVGHAHAH